jgi:hypothetical protein
LNTNTDGFSGSGGIVLYFASGVYRLFGGNLQLNGPSVTLNAWNHVAVTMPSGANGSTSTLWINGSSAGTVVLGQNQNSTNLYIGGKVYGAMLGYVSNFRYVRGVQVYTGTFTPPTRPLTDTQSAGTNISAITAGQTQLLLNTATAGTYLTDSSSYARTVTPTDSITYSASNPF